MELANVVGIGCFVLMVAGTVFCCYLIMSDEELSYAAVDGGLMIACLGAEFILLYLIKVGYIEMGPIVYILFGCFTLIIILAFIHGVIPRKP